MCAAVPPAFLLSLLLCQGPSSRVMLLLPLLLQAQSACLAPRPGLQQDGSNSCFHAPCRTAAFPVAPLECSGGCRNPRPIGLVLHYLHKDCKQTPRCQVPSLMAFSVHCARPPHKLSDQQPTTLRLTAYTKPVSHSLHNLCYSIRVIHELTAITRH